MTYNLDEARRLVEAGPGPWGRAVPEWAVEMVREADPGAAELDLEAAFLEVGLCEDDARSAADGLRAGRYLSFEDAVEARVRWDRQGRNRNLDRAKVARIAARLSPKPAVLDPATAVQEAVLREYPGATEISVDEQANRVHFRPASPSNMRYQLPYDRDNYQSNVYFGWNKLKVTEV